MPFESSCFPVQPGAGVIRRISSYEHRMGSSHDQLEGPAPRAGWRGL